MVVVDKVRHDKHGFLGVDGKWYANKFKEFNVSKGDEVEVVMKGDFLQEVKIISKSPEVNQTSPMSNSPQGPSFNQEKDRSITAQCLVKAVLGQVDSKVGIEGAVELYKTAVKLLSEVEDETK